MLSRLEKIDVLKKAHGKKWLQEMTGTHTSWTYIFCLKDDGVYHAGAIDNSDLSVIKR